MFLFSVFLPFVFRIFLSFFHSFPSLPFQEEPTFLNTEGISLHQKLCNKLILAERNILQNALKYVAVLKSKVSGTASNGETTCEQENLKEGDKPPPSSSHVVDEASTALGQLNIQA